VAVFLSAEVDSKDQMQRAQALPPTARRRRTFIFFRQRGRKCKRVLLPQPTMRTEKDIGSEKPETTTVSGFFVSFFKVEFKRYHFPKTTVGEDLNYDN